MTAMACEWGWVWRGTDVAPRVPQLPLAHILLPSAPHRVTVAELQAHAELDVDGDGTLSEAEAQVLGRGATEAPAAEGLCRAWICHVPLLGRGPRCLDSLSYPILSCSVLFFS